METCDQEDRLIHLRRAPLVLAVVAAALVAGCGSSQQGSHSATTAQSQDPTQRAVRLETVGCGFASGRTGSGVAIGDGLVISVAHLIVRAKSVQAQVYGQEFGDVGVAAVDLRRDLAVLRLGSDATLPVEMSAADKGARGRIVGGSASGTVAFEVKGVVDLTIEEVLGTARYSRRGYEVEAMTADGDSGAGAYDDQNRLIGIVFATGQDGATTWLTASSELEKFLSTVGPSDTYALCQ